MKILDVINEVHIDLSAGLTAPINQADTITVYHNFRNINDAITAIQYGLSGASEPTRAYSYEADNNPKGLFVSSDFKTVDDFGSTIIEFNVQVKDLDPPVWPSGSYTVQGGLSQYWGHGKQGLIKRKAAQKSLRSQYKQDNSLPPEVKNSEDPLLAYSLTQMYEKQALFVGHLHPSAITRVFVRKDNRIHSWEEVSKEEFIERNSEHVNDPNVRRVEKRRIFSPTDEFDENKFKSELSKKFGSNIEPNLNNLWKRQILANPENKGYYFKDAMEHFLWPKQMPAAYKWFGKTFGFKPTS